MSDLFPRPPQFLGVQHPGDAARADDALRANRRYILQIVEGCGFCPWAEPARKAGNVREVVWMNAPSPDAFFAHADSWAQDASTHVVLVVMPDGATDRRTHEQYARVLRDFDAARAHTQANVFAIAAFHPEATADTTHAQRLIAFLRRSPYPTLQLVRRSVLDDLREGRDEVRYVDPSSADMIALAESPAKKALHERIAEANLSTVERMGVDALTQALDAIKRSRS